MKYLFLVLFAITFFCSCSHKEALSVEALMSSMSERKMIMDDSEGVKSLNVDSLSLLPSQCFLYVLNASCSTCIYTFVDFLNETSSVNVPIVVVIDKNYKPQLDYVLEQVHMKSSVVVVENDNGKYLKGTIEELGTNGLFLYLKNNEICKSYFFVSKGINIDNNS